MAVEMQEISASDSRIREICRTAEAMASTATEPISTIELAAHLSHHNCIVVNEDEIKVALGVLYGQGRIRLYGSSAGAFGRFMCGFSKA
jgi:hypothetical protein